MAWRHVQAMLDISHWQSFESGKYPDVEGLPAFPYERITKFLYRQHLQVAVRPVARKLHVSANRHLGVSLGEVGGCGQVFGYSMGEKGVGAVPALPDVDSVAGGVNQIEI